MKTLTIKDLSREEGLDRKVMAEVRGGEKVTVIYSPIYEGMTVGQAIQAFAQYGKDLHDALS